MTDSLTRSDLSVLLRIVGSRNGADFDGILAFQASHHRQGPTGEQIQESLNRLLNAGLIVQREKRYVGAPQLQAAFLDETRNCSDTMEEFDILNRIIAQFRKPQGDEYLTESQPRWRRNL